MCYGFNTQKSMGQTQDYTWRWMGRSVRGYSRERHGWVSRTPGSLHTITASSQLGIGQTHTERPRTSSRPALANCEPTQKGSTITNSRAPKTDCLGGKKTFLHQMSKHSRWIGLGSYFRLGWGVRIQAQKEGGSHVSLLAQSEKVEEGMWPAPAAVTEPRVGVRVGSLQNKCVTVVSPHHFLKLPRQNCSGKRCWHKA